MPSPLAVTVRLMPVCLLVTTSWSPAVARPAMAPVVLCAMATGAIAPMHAPSATHSAAFLKVLLFIPVSLPQWC